ncbi:MAG TPA: hypothetical protein VGN12_17585 [Pirellulales bacterium]|jgi:hypothetical protein
MTASGAFVEASDRSHFAPRSPVVRQASAQAQLRIILTELSALIEVSTSKGNLFSGHTPQSCSPVLDCRRARVLHVFQDSTRFRR